MKNIEVHIQCCREGAVLPHYAKPNDAGMDICAAEECVVLPGETVKVPTGLKLAVPEGYEMQIRPRSGLSANTLLRIPNAPGTVDAGYRDEVMVLIYNASGQDSEENIALDEKGNKAGRYLIKKGERIAQMVLVENPRICWNPVEDVKRFGGNRGGGFGSTGV